MDKPDQLYDRRVSTALLQALTPGGPLASFVDWARREPTVADVQLRHDPKSKASWATLYIGLTGVLNLYERSGRFRFTVGASHRKRGNFDLAWSEPRTLEDASALWPEVVAYLDRLRPRVGARHVRSEGAVQSTLCNRSTHAWRVLDREASTHFLDQAAKSRIGKEIGAPLYQAVDDAGAGARWWPGVRGGGKHENFGTGLDVLGVDDRGRILAVEVKPANALKGIVWAPAQVQFYAEMFARWMELTPNRAEVLNGMADQRAALGLAVPGPTTTAEVIVPVVAIGAGPVGPQARARLLEVARALQAATPHRRVQPLEVWRLDERAQITERWI